MGRLMTTAEVAEMLHVSKFHVRRLAASGELRPVGNELRKGRGRPSLMFAEAEVIEYELAHRKDQHVATLAAIWRESA